MRARRRTAILPYLLMLPALLLLVGMIYPFCLGVYYSLTSYFLQYPHLFRFIGLGNYLKMPGDPLFAYSVQFTLAYTAVAVLIQVSLGVGVALLLHGRIIARGVLRAMMLMPLMMPPVITALMWKVMMASTKAGILNHLLGVVGLGPVNWLGSVNSAMVSVLIIDTWGNLPFVSLILLGGLQSLPYEPYEAAVVDGAGGLDVLRYITLPLLKPFIILATTFRIMDSLRIFDVIYATTVGGPADATMNLHMRAFFYAFQWYQMGMGMAYAMVLLVLVFIASYVLMRYWRRAAEQTEL
ncbi:MAG: putative transporter permease protein [candidate division NC10 bacterium]|nr:putative transporter permease protein [candidate division NC10 bacterium]